MSEHPREIFTRDESAELLDLTRAWVDTYGAYTRAMSFRLDEEAVDKAFEATQDAAKAVETWVTDRTHTHGGHT